MQGESGEGAAIPETVRMCLTISCGLQSAIFLHLQKELSPFVRLPTQYFIAFTACAQWTHVPSHWPDSKQPSDATGSKPRDSCLLDVQGKDDKANVQMSNIINFGTTFLVRPRPWRG